MQATHAEINRIINACASRVGAKRLVAISQTARQWQAMGMSAQAIANLVGYVPVRKDH